MPNSGNCAVLYEIQIAASLAANAQNRSLKDFSFKLYIHPFHLKNIIFQIYCLFILLIISLISQKMVKQMLIFINLIYMYID